MRYGFSSQHLVAALLVTGFVVLGSPAPAWSSGSVTVSTAAELIEAMDAANRPDGPNHIELLPGEYAFGEPLPRILRGNLHVEGTGDDTIINGEGVAAVGETPLAFASPAAFDILASDVTIEGLVIEDWDVGIRVTDGVPIGPEPDTRPGAVWCPDPQVAGESVRNVTVEDVVFQNVFAAYRATANGIETELTGLELDRVGCDDVVECIVVSNDCGAKGTLIEVQLEDVTITNLHPEGGEFGLMGVGVAVGGFGEGSENTVLGRIDGVTVSDDYAGTSNGFSFSGGSYGATLGTTIIEASDTTAENVGTGYALLGGSLSQGGSTLRVDLYDATATEIGSWALVVLGSEISGYNSITSSISDFDASGPDALGAAFISGGFPTYNSIELDISDARIAFEDGFLLREQFFGEEGGNTIDLHLDDVTHCGSGFGVLRLEDTPGAIKVTLDGETVPGRVIDLRPCD